MTLEKFRKRWHPRPSDVEWTRNMLTCLNDGGIWGVPRNQSIWKHIKDRKVLRCIYGPKDDEMFMMITLCCEACGYATEHGLETVAPDITKHCLSGNGQMLNLDLSQYGMGKTTENVSPSNN